MNRHRPSHSKQTGAVLVVSLMLLVVMTLIGVTSMRSSIMEEKMAGNARDTMLAMEAAETALLDGEDYLANTINSLAVAFNGDPQEGLYAMGTNPNPLAQATWANSIAYRDTYTGVGSQPRFIIEHIGAISEADDSLDIVSYDSVDSLGTPHAFRVTARGTGGTDSAVVLLRSNFVRDF